MAQRKMNLTKLRALHATLGALIAESDATLEGGTLESDDQPTTAQDAALSPTRRASHKEMMEMAGGSEVYLRMQNSRGWQAPKK